MADGGGNANKSAPRDYDPRNDANWQARLDEARAKRERILAQKKTDPRPKKRLKPWEEEGAIVFDDDPDFSPAETGIEFSERVDAMRKPREETPSPQTPSQSKPSETQAAPPKPQPPTPPALQPVDDVPEPRYEDRPTHGEVPLRPSLKVVPKPPVNRVISDPYLVRNYTDPFEEFDKGPLSIKDLYVGPPEPVRPSRVVRVEPEVDLSALRQPTKLEKFKRGTKSSPWAVVAFFAAALSVGPIYQLVRPIERGPMVYTLSAFPFEPAYGLTAPIFGQPMATGAQDWLPVARMPVTDLATPARPSVPERMMTVPPLNDVAVPQDEADLNIGPVMLTRRITGGAAPLPTVFADSASFVGSAD